ncbi:hypothetical protein B296_00024359 [Ensete ventricosum]|uniref:Uncharacterized protein n=1 Tax=Ensete ventricosum TaxID=4639 RepID=A0A426Z6C3_ENSVE|nr:hypothetical protein B296_00024359 [Ensete ventricosum]
MQEHASLGAKSSPARAWRKSTAGTCAVRRASTVGFAMGRCSTANATAPRNVEHLNRPINATRIVLAAASETL